MENFDGMVKWTWIKDVLNIKFYVFTEASLWYRLG